MVTLQIRFIKLLLLIEIGSLIYYQNKHDCLWFIKLLPFLNKHDKLWLVKLLLFQSKYCSLWPWSLANMNLFLTFILTICTILFISRMLRRRYPTWTASGWEVDQSEQTGPPENHQLPQLKRVCMVRMRNMFHFDLVSSSLF